MDKKEFENHIYISNFKISIEEQMSELIRETLRYRLLNVDSLSTEEIEEIERLYNILGRFTIGLKGQISTGSDGENDYSYLRVEHADCVSLAKILEKLYKEWLSIEWHNQMCNLYSKKRSWNLGYDGEIRYFWKEEDNKILETDSGIMKFLEDFLPILWHRNELLRFQKK